MNVLLEGTIALLVVAGAAFALLGSIGLVRFPDFYSRLHAPSKATTLGLGCLLLGSLLYFARDGVLSLHEVPFALFVALTTPVSAHLLARAARHRRLHDVSRGGRVQRTDEQSQRDRDVGGELKDGFPAGDPSPPKHGD
jgi:multicomponent K+:H+ antiporter subunit G